MQKKQSFEKDVDANDASFAPTSAVVVVVVAFDYVVAAMIVYVGIGVGVSIGVSASVPANPKIDAILPCGRSGCSVPL